MRKSTSRIEGEKSRKMGLGDLLAEPRKGALLGWNAG
jgi:hypothetical protein